MRIDHEIFDLVYEFKEIPRVLSIRAWERGLTYEDWHGSYEGADKDPHFQRYFDEDGHAVIPVPGPGDYVIRPHVYVSGKDNVGRGGSLRMTSRPTIEVLETRA